MRIIPFATVLALCGGLASAQVTHPGEVERWFLALAPLHEAKACITDQDPLRPGLEALLQDTQGRATRAIRSEYEKGLLAGRLYPHASGEAMPDPSDDICQQILARAARGLLRLHVP